MLTELCVPVSLLRGLVLMEFLEQIVTNVVVQLIILLYLIDNNEQTSWMILMGNGIGVLIEAWKVCHPSVPLWTRTL